MRLMSTTALVASAALLVACDEAAVANFSTREAGFAVNEGGYGAAVDHNSAVHAGLKQVVIDLSAKFAREVPNAVTFEFNSARLDGAARTALRRQADWIRQFPEVRFRVYGHTDLVGSEGYNERLGRQRAQAVVNFLASQGVSPARLEAMVSFGETEPVIATEDRERRNRRAVTDVAGFIGPSDQPLDGRYANLVYRTYIAGEVIVEFDREKQR